jgi:hypothetical protein
LILSLALNFSLASHVWWCTTVIPATEEVETEESWFDTSLNKKLVIPYLKNKLSVVMHTCGPSYSGNGGRRIGMRLAKAQSTSPYLRNKPKAKGLTAWLKWSRL